MSGRAQPEPARDRRLASTLANLLRAELAEVQGAPAARPRSHGGLRTALEALFLDRGNNAEPAYRLATNGAWYTAGNREERRRKHDVLKSVYRAASGAAHRRRTKRGDAGLLRDGQAICGFAILKRLRPGKAPVWEKLVFGG